MKTRIVEEYADEYGALLILAPVIIPLALIAVAWIILWGFLLDEIIYIKS